LSGSGLQSHSFADQGCYFLRLKRPTQTVRAEQDHVAGEDVMFAGISTHKEIVADGAGKHMTGLGLQGLARGHDPEAHLFADYRMIAGKQVGLPAPQQITAGVPHVSHGKAVEAEGASDDGGCHRNTARAGGFTGLVDPGIGGLNQAREQGQVRFAGSGITKASEQAFYRGAGSNLAEVLPSDAIGDDKEPSVGSHPLHCLGQNVADKVLIVVTRPPGIRELGEVEL